MTLPVLAALRELIQSPFRCAVPSGTRQVAGSANCVDEWRDLEARDWVGLFVDEPLRESDSNAWLWV